MFHFTPFSGREGIKKAFLKGRWQARLTDKGLIVVNITYTLYCIKALITFDARPDAVHIKINEYRERIIIYEK